MKGGAIYTGQVHGIVPGTLEEIRYWRTKDHPGPYKHPFRSSARILALEDGRLLIEPKEEGTMLWLDNPQRHHGKHQGGHRHNDPDPSRRHHHNPYLAAFNPGVVQAVRGVFTQQYAMAALSGSAGFGVTYLGYKALFSLTALSNYGSGMDWTSILVRALGRLGVAAVGDSLLMRFFAGHNRLAYAGGAAAYVGAATLLEATGYQVAIGAPGGAPLASVLPAALQSQASVAGAGYYINAPADHIPGIGSYVRRPLSLGSRMAIEETGAETSLVL